MTSRLTPSDIQALVANPSPEVRADIALKLGHEFSDGVFTAKERAIAEQVLRLMAKDAAARVRTALATSLATAIDLPADVVHTLAHDLDPISIPFVETTPLLSDHDLVALIRAGSMTKQQAVARRPAVSETVVDALVGTGKVEVMRTLVANDGATLSERAFETILDRHGQDTTITTPMVERQSLPLTVAERLVTMVSEELRSRLITHHKVPRHVAERLAEQSRERATVDLLGQAREVANIAELVQQLRATGRLTPSLLLRAAITGDLRFCEEAFGQLAGLPTHKAWILIHDAGPLGLRAIYDRAKLPEVLYPAFRVAVDVFHETAFDGGPRDMERFQRRMLERVLTQYADIAADDLEFLLDRLGRLTEETEDAPRAVSQ